MRVAIVNDSRAAAEVLRRILAEVPEFELAWTAYSGEEALRRAIADPADIVLMDLILPGMDGAATTQELMRKAPCVILIVTATTVGNRGLVFEAMGHGALDAVNTPTLGPKGDMAGAAPLLQKLRTVARLVAPSTAKVILKHPIKPVGHAVTNARLSIVAIGASTGGPQALAEVLKHLPADFAAAVLIAQHVDDHFSPALAEWLQHNCALPVRLARDRERVTPGGVWLGSSSDHLVYDAEGVMRYTPHPRKTPYRPSADALFASLADAQPSLRIGVLLTGMGRDGAVGLLAMRNAGALTLAQDAATSVVYGMPKAAAELNAAMEVLPITAIGQRIVTAVSATHGLPTQPRRSGLFAARKTQNP
jgi:two-component system response regulator WspF